MQIRAELCHVDTLRCIVRIEAWQGNQLLGSALGEAQTSEEAETRGLERLMRRIAPSQPEAVPAEAVSAEAVSAEAVSPKVAVDVSGPERAQPEVTAADSTEPLTTSSGRTAPSGKPQQPSKPEPKSTTGQRQQPTPDPPSEAPTDPEDWSEELAAIDLEVQRIGWDRDRERIYLERAFGHASRHRLTRYSDLVGFLRQLRDMQPGESPETAAVPLRRSDLLSQGDEMIRAMGWSSAQARECLQKELGATSRQQLSDQQLMQFNMILENLMTTTNE